MITYNSDNYFVVETADTSRPKRLRFYIHQIQIEKQGITRLRVGIHARAIEIVFKRSLRLRIGTHDLVEIRFNQIVHVEFHTIRIIFAFLQRTSIFFSI